jgi:hypothetical protein
MFNNITITKGFPIPTRSNVGPGIDMPLDMAASLISAPRIVQFNDRLLIKGFSAMLYPTNYFEDIVVWHLLINPEDERISYADMRARKGIHISTNKLNYGILEDARHIIGWCSYVKSFAGMNHEPDIAHCRTVIYRILTK